MAGDLHLELAAATAAVTYDPVMQEFIDGLNQLTTSRYLCGAALTVSLYDWLLLSGDEYHTIWKAKWTLPKAIYYFNRVVTPVGLAMATFQLTDLRTTNLSTRFCHLYTFINSLVELLSFFLSNWLLTLRLVALYKRKKWVIWFLYSFLAASYITTAGLMVFTLYTFGQTIQYNLIFHACGSSSRSPLMPAIFLAPAAFELTLFFLTAFSAWRDAQVMSSSGSAPFLRVLYRDGLICFFVMFGVRAWNVWIYAAEPLTSAYLGIYLLWAVMTILSTRVYLNLVFLARKPILEHTEVSQAQFAVGPLRTVDGIRMHVHTTTTYADASTIGGSRGRRPWRHGMTLDTSFGIDTALPEEIVQESVQRTPVEEGTYTRSVSWMIGTKMEH